MSRGRIGACGVAVVALAACASGDEGPATFHRDIAPILFAHCASCHRSGGAGPFSLMSYAQARAHSRDIGTVTASGFMPPWQPDRLGPELHGQRGLDPGQIATLRRWIEQGSPEGDPADAPPPPEFVEGWQLGQPDLVVDLPVPYTLPAEGIDVIRNFVVPVPTQAPRWVRTVELRPGNPRIVHHAILKIDRTRYSRRLDAADDEPGFSGMDMGNSEDPDGQVIVWAPGTTAWPGVDGMAWRLAPGSDAVLQLHMVPGGKPETLVPSIGFHFSHEPPRLLPLGLMLKNERIDIPAGADAHPVEDSLPLPAAVRVLGLFPHAHYLGKRMEIWADLPGGARRELLHIPDWDFNWQDMYRYVEPVELPAGSTLRMRYTYDNSEDNVRNPSYPPVRVVGGNRSTDEMATLAVQVLPVDPADASRIQAAQYLDNLRDDPDDAMAHYNLGVVYARLGELALALRHYERAVALDPADAFAHYGLGSVYARRGELERAAERYSEAVRLQPTFAEARYILGKVYLDLGRLEHAVEQFRNALEIQPAYPAAYHKLGLIAWRRGDLDGAERYLQRALELQPAFTDARADLERLQRNRDGAD